MPQRKLVRADIDTDLCVGSAMCVSSAFRLGAGGHATYIADTLDEAAALEAAEFCPVSATQLIDEE